MINHYTRTTTTGQQRASLSSGLLVVPYLVNSACQEQFAEGSRLRETANFLDLHNLRLASSSGCIQSEATMHPEDKTRLFLGFGAKPQNKQGALAGKATVTRQGGYKALNANRESSFLLVFQNDSKDLDEHLGFVPLSVRSIWRGCVAIPPSITA